jgi:hypothetical protein
MTNPCASVCQDRRLRSGAARARRKSERKKLSPLFPGNPLISLDSDERIQGNPRKSNPHERGFSRRNGDWPRKPKRIDRTKVPGPAAEKEPNRLHAKRSKGEGGARERVESGCREPRRHAISLVCRLSMRASPRSLATARHCRTLTSTAYARRRQIISAKKAFVVSILYRYIDLYSNKY